MHWNTPPTPHPTGHTSFHILFPPAGDAAPIRLRCNLTSSIGAEDPYLGPKLDDFLGRAQNRRPSVGPQAERNPQWPRSTSYASGQSEASTAWRTGSVTRSFWRVLETARQRGPNSLHPQSCIFPKRRTSRESESITHSINPSTAETSLRRTFLIDGAAVEK